MKHKVSLYFSLVCAAALFLSAAPLERYHTPEEVNASLKTLGERHAQTAELLTIGRSAGGKDIKVLRIASENPSYSKPENRPSILVTANLEGTHLIGTEAALHLAGELLTRYGKDKNITQLLHTRTIYIAPLLNPDVAGFYFSDLKIERKGNLKPVDDDLDGRDDEDGPDDLNKDGVITQMRVKDPEGTQIAHPSESRLLIQADPKKGQSGLYKVYTEGLDNDGDGLINEDHPGGVELNRNFPHDYEYNNPQTGLHPLSEKETVALIQFMLSKPNIVLVLNYSTENTFLNLQQTGRAQAAGNKIKATGRFATMLGLEEDKEYEVQEIVDIIKNSGMVPAGMEVDASLVAMIFGSGPAMNIDNLDMPSFLEIQKQYKDALKKAEPDYPQNRATGVVKGSFAAYCYFQHGVQVFSSDLWAVPEPKKEPVKDALTPEKLKDMSNDDFLALGEDKIAAFLKEQGAPDNIKPAMVINMVKSGQLTPARMADMIDQMPKKPGGDGEEHPDAYLLKWAAEARPDKGFVDWTSFNHPTLGEVEIGGFVPYLQTPPPALAEKTIAVHTDFYIGLMEKIGQIAVKKVHVAALENGLYRLTVHFTNPGWFPTSTAQARRARTAWPIRIECGLSRSQTIFSGQNVVTLPFLDGSGGTAKAEWTIKGKKGSKVTLTASAPGLGTETVSVVLQ